MSELGSEEEKIGTSHSTDKAILNVCLEADTNC
jgi:hypothetical protein